MKKALFIKLIFLTGICLTAFGSGFAQPSKSTLEEDKTPSIVKNLPDSDNARNRATYTKNTDDLRKTLGERSIFDLVNLGNGVEAVTANYPEGKLLIVEYPTPQASIEANAQFNQRLAENAPNPPIYYRRTGNYSVFVFDASDEAAANTLLDQVKYEKTVQWLGENPMPAIRAEREFAIMTGDIFLSTVIVVIVGFGSTILVGLAVGLFFFYIREHKRKTTHIYTDAGGMTRLNLDNLTPDVLSDRLLKD